MQQPHGDDFCALLQSTMTAIGGPHRLHALHTTPHMHGNGTEGLLMSEAVRVFSA